MENELEETLCLSLQTVAATCTMLERILKLHLSLDRKTQK